MSLPDSQSHTDLQQLQNAKDGLHRLDKFLWSEALKTLAAVGPQNSISEGSVTNVKANLKRRQAVKAYLEEIEAKIRAVNTDIPKSERPVNLAAFEEASALLWKVGLGGVALTYATIFTALRGNIGYMTWAFSMFMAGTVTSIMAISLASLSAKVNGGWESLVRFIYSLSEFFILAALVLLTCPLVTLNADGAQVVLTISSKNSAIFMYSILGTGFVAVVLMGMVKSRPRGEGGNESAG